LYYTTKLDSLDQSSIWKVLCRTLSSSYSHKATDSKYCSSCLSDTRNCVWSLLWGFRLNCPQFVAKPLACKTEDNSNQRESGSLPSLISRPLTLKVCYAMCTKLVYCYYFWHPWKVWNNTFH
jgi:hypothetical protein